MGLEFLRALSYVDIPWLKVGTEGGKRDRLETVYHRNMRGRSVALRCYDKGVESDTCAAGGGFGSSANGAGGRIRREPSTT